MRGGDKLRIKTTAPAGCEAVVDTGGTLAETTEAGVYAVCAVAADGAPTPYVAVTFEKSDMLSGDGWSATGAASAGDSVDVDAAAGP